MSKKYYYTCPIKALYMMKEFGVEYDFENEEGLIRIIKTPEIRRDNFMRKIYVAKESEHIFEPKKGDKDENGLFFDGKHWTDGISYAISSEQSKTSFRFGKQFFMPEVENETRNNE
jgi:hypothetical protein